MPGRDICKGRNTETIAGQKPVDIRTVAGEFPSKHLVGWIRKQNGRIVNCPTPVLATRT
jgi:hypothetical protein